MMKLDHVLASYGRPLGCNVDDFAKLALLQIGEEVLARKEWPLYRPGELEMERRLCAMVRHTTVMTRYL